MLDRLRNERRIVLITPNGDLLATHDRAPVYIAFLSQSRASIIRANERCGERLLYCAGKACGRREEIVTAVVWDTGRQVSKVKSAAVSRLNLRVNSPRYIAKCRRAFLSSRSRRSAARLGPQCGNRYSAVHKKFFFWPNFCPDLLPNSFQPGCWREACKNFILHDVRNLVRF